MERDEIRRILRSVREGGLEVEEALDRLRLLPIERLGFATLDLQRALRRGFPEVIFGPGKNADEIVGIARRMVEAGQTVLVTRVGPEVHTALRELDSRAVYHPKARAVTLPCGPSRTPKPGITVFTAGTSDRGVAEEAIVTAETMGNEVRRAFDVGIAGVHRLLEHREAFLESNVVVVVAGMEGALASLVSGLTDCPVIGVPTSTGYGMGAKGEAALMAMLNSCAAGLTVVNIDNGFGAGYAAALINRNNQKTGEKDGPKGNR